MKRLITILLLITITSPLFFGAAEGQSSPAIQGPDTEPVWTLHVQRTIIWIGEEINVIVNGTANTTISLELVPIGANNTVGNATFYETHVTDAQGITGFTIPTDTTQEAGEYKIRLIHERVAVAEQAVTINFDPIRWLEILILRNDDRDDEQDAAIQEGVLRDNEILAELDKCYKVLVIVVLLFAAYMLLTIELYLNYHIYKRIKKGKKPNLGWLISDDNAEFFHIAGGIIRDSPPVLKDKINGVDISHMGLGGKDTRGIITTINDRLGKRKNVRVQKMPPVGIGTSKSRKQSRKAAVLSQDIVKDLEKEDEEKKEGE